MKIYQQHAPFIKKGTGYNKKHMSNQKKDGIRACPSEAPGKRQPKTDQPLAGRRALPTGRQGFTLVELLIVVGIIGLLSSVTLVGLGSFRARGRDARRVADLREVQNALELYYTQSQAYPPTTGSTADGTSWRSMVTAITGASVGVSSLPTTAPAPAPNAIYNYGSPSGNQSYVLQATLEDPNNPALANDLDLDTYTVSCDQSTEYCLQF